MKKYFKAILSFILISALIFSFANINILSYADTYGLSNPKIEDNLTTWDCVYFGNYWQEEYEPLEIPEELKDGVNHEGKYNGRVYTDSDGTEFMYIESLYGQAFVKKSQIKWRVLSVNGNDAFLLSEYNLFCGDNPDYIEPDYLNPVSTSKSWENSQERKSLNENFYNSVFCKPFLHKIAKCFCRLLHLHFVGNCKASTDRYSASRKTLQTLFNCYSTRYGNGSSEFSSSCACSLK